MDHCSIEGNSASYGGGVSAFTQPRLLHTIIAGNTDLSGAAPDCDGTVISRGYRAVEVPEPRMQLLGQVALVALAMLGGTGRRARRGRSAPWRRGS